MTGSGPSGCAREQGSYFPGKLIDRGVLWFHTRYALDGANLESPEQPQWSNSQSPSEVTLLIQQDSPSICDALVPLIMSI